MIGELHNITVRGVGQLEQRKPINKTHQMMTRYSMYEHEMATQVSK